MKTLIIHDLSASTELDSKTMADIHGGRMKIPGQHNNGTILVSPDGEPVDVYVDGVLQNSVGDGFYHTH
ncbi:hypothetical protein PPMP20_32430 [Paraburkholderia phymatum]|uniref:Uncharacterized protein n=1 Tax=Paraburkholderia phymatum (strain DSM 17167 / CIP 108236 / LMG 21445 / STM815) TaxID=391038 RepID=B2JHN2_PARP8|nr:hypothetical protein [Paraburkholderia phymatum]ACC70374.1 hypothetical protein Bphy_1185 [Paraburkholderia phymatum STM815]